MALVLVCRHLLNSIEAIQRSVTSKKQIDHSGEMLELACAHAGDDVISHLSVNL